MNLKFLSVISGVCFAIWPFFLNKCGLPNLLSTAVFSGVVFVIVSIPAISQISSLDKANWSMICLASLVGAIGIITFNAVVMKVKAQEISPFFMASIITEVSILSAGAIISNGQLTLEKVVGLACAFVATFLLLK